MKLHEINSSKFAANSMKTDKMTRTKLVQGREISINSWPGKEERNKLAGLHVNFLSRK